MSFFFNREKDPSLWVSALSYFAEKNALPVSGQSSDSTRQMLQVVLDNIEKKNLLPPLQVIQVLSKNPSITVGTIKDYLIRKITSEKKLIEEVKPYVFV
jgi:hypothetical protein